MTTTTKYSQLMAKLRQNRRQLGIDVLASPQRRYFSPILYGQYQVTLPLMKQYLRGRLIDLGCGDLPFQSELVEQITAYHSVDLFPRSNAVTFVGDIQTLALASDSHYDSALCLEVLEHVPDPFQAIREVYRLLAPHGILILSVPHLSRLHDEPHDYYRYTKYGLTYLLEQAGFTIICIEKRGGLLTFLGHQISTLALGIVWSIPTLRKIAWWLNSWLVTRLFYNLDKPLNKAGIFAAGYTVVARK